MVISVGPNSYGHPTRKALELYLSAGANVMRTDLNGTLTFTVKLDGSHTLLLPQSRVLDAAGGGAPHKRMLPDCRVTR